MKSHLEPSLGLPQKKKRIRKTYKFILLVLLLLIFIALYRWLPAPGVLEAADSLEIKQSFDSPFKIQFSQNMNHNSTEEAFKIQPSLEGQFIWEDKKTLLFQPDKPLRIDQEYRIYIDQGAKNWYGKKMHQTAKLYFTITGPPTIIFASSLPSDSDSETPTLSIVGKDEPLTVMFDRPMEWESVAEDQLIVFDPPIRGEIAFLGTSAFQFYPNQWPIDKQFSATVPAGIQGIGGGKMSESFSWEFRTPRLQVAASNLDAPLSPEDSIAIHFNREVDLNQVRPGENILLFPTNDLEKTGLEDDGFFNTEVTYDYDENGNVQKQTLIFKPTFPFQSDVEHRFLINSDFDGLEIPFETTFYVQEDQNELLSDDSASQSISGQDPFNWVQNSPWPLFLEQDPLEFQFESNNIDSINLYLCKISESDFIRIQQSSENPAYNCDQNRTQLSLNENQNSIDLNELIELEWSSGIYFLSAEVSIGEQVQRFDQGFFISDTLLLIKQSPWDVFVWAVDARTLEPVSRMELTILDATGEIALKGITDGKGVYKTIREVPQETYILASKQIEGEDRFAFTSPNLLRQNPQESKESSVYLTASSNILNDTNTFLVKGVWRFFEQGAWLLPSHPFITLALENNLGETIVSEEIPVKQNGSFDHFWELPEDLPSGEYFVSAFLAGGRINSNPLAIQINPSVSDVLLTWLAAEPFYLQGRIPILTLKAFYEGDLPASQLKGVWDLYRVDGYQPELIDHQNFSFDSKGLTQIPLDTALEEKGTYKVVVTIQDANRRSSEIDHVFKIQAGQYQTLIETKHRFLEPGDPLSIKARHVDSDNNPLFGFKTVFSLINTENDRKVWSNDATFTEEDVFVDFEIPSNLTSGPYVLTAESRDDQGREIIGNETVYILKEVNEEALYPNIRLLADQDVFFSGGKADLLINAPEASEENPLTVLLTYERDRVFENEVVTLESPLTRVQTPIRSSMVPYVQVKAYFPEAQVDNSSISFEEVTLNLKTKAPEDELFIDVEMEPETPQPGDEVTLSFKVHDHQDLPVSSVLTLNARDQKTVLPSLPDHFLAPRNASTITFSNANLFNLVKEKNNSLQSKSQYLSQTWNSLWFEPFLESDVNGQAQIQFTLPETEEAWFLDVMATSEETRFGTRSIPLLRQDEIQFNSFLPTALTLGDQVNLKIQLQNHGSETFTSQMELSSPYFEMSSSARQTFSLEPNQKLFLTWQGKVTGFDESGHLTLRFIWGEEERSETIIVQSMPELKVLSRGKVDSDENKGSFTAPESLFGEAGGVYFDFNSSPEPFLNEAIFASAHFAYNNLDSLIRHVLIELSIGNHESLDENFQAQIDKIIDFQVEDEGIDLWEKANSSHLTSTAYALLALQWASEKGYQVPEEQLSDLKDFLVNNLLSSSLSYKERLLTLWVLTQVQVYDTELILNLFQEKDSFSASENALLLMILNEVKQAGQNSLNSFIDSLLSDIASMGIEEEDQFFFKGSAKDALKGNALMLYAFYKVDPDNILTDKMLNFLSSQRASLENPLDLESLLWLALAFSETLNQNTFSSSPLTLDLNGQSLESESFLPSTNLSLDQENHWKLNVNGPAYLSAYWLYALEASQIGAIEQKALITRLYRDMETGQEVDQMQVGRWYEGELLFILPSAQQDVLVESFLPTGVRALSFTSPLFGGFDSTSNSIRGAWQFEEASMDNNQILLYSSFLPSGVYSIRYMVQAGLPGQFQHLPATLQVMYQREVYARTAGGVLVIEP